MKKKNIFFVLLICFINSSCNKEEQTDELQDKDLWFLLEGAIRVSGHLLKGITKASIHLYLDTWNV